MDFPGSSAGKESACNAGNPSLIPGSGRSPGEGVGYPLWYSWASLMAQMVKNLPVTRETWVQSLGWEDSLEESMATHCRNSCLKNPHGQRSLEGYSPWGHKESDTAERLSAAHSIRDRYIYPNPQNSGHQEGSVNLDCGLWVMMHQCRFNNCSKCVMGESVHVWGQKAFQKSPQFHCEPKTTLGKSK